MKIFCIITILQTDYYESFFVYYAWLIFFVFIFRIIVNILIESQIKQQRKKEMLGAPKKCAKCDKQVYPIEELKCLDKVLIVIIFKSQFQINSLNN